MIKALTTNDQSYKVFLLQQKISPTWVICPSLKATIYIYISSMKRASLNHCINFIRLKEKLRATKFSHFLPKFLSLLITIVCCKQQKLYTSNSLKHRLPTQSETQTSLRINADR